MDLNAMNQDPNYIQTGILLLEDGSLFKGFGTGSTGIVCGEICFNTSITGYQEILTDPSYDQQIVCFTFPHIGNCGTNPDDSEASFPKKPKACGAIFREKITPPSNWRSKKHFSNWLDQQNIISIYGIDTRFLTKKIREKGSINGLIAYQKNGVFPIHSYQEQLKNWNGLLDQDLACNASLKSQTLWHHHAPSFSKIHFNESEYSDQKTKIAVIDFGIKTNILNIISQFNTEITVYPGNTDATHILAQNPDGIILSNGPGDPQLTHHSVRHLISALLDSEIPLLAICLGHQLLALNLGGQTLKMKQGHHGANHPVKNLMTQQVEIVSMNHGFTVNMSSLPETVEQTHISLFDGSNCGFRIKNKPVLSVQHHPESSPGPHDCRAIFSEFYTLVHRYQHARHASSLSKKNYNIS